jgi:dUTP pyrophosphatase
MCELKKIEYKVTRGFTRVSRMVLTGRRNAEDEEDTCVEWVPPKRATHKAAGYDLSHYGPTINIPAKGLTYLFTGTKVQMQEDEVLLVALRSSLAKKGLALVNGVGVIDADYFYSTKPPAQGAEPGEIILAVRNVRNRPIEIGEGERIAQGIFTKYLRVDGDVPGGARVGGFGSTGSFEQLEKQLELYQ